MKAAVLYQKGELPQYVDFPEPVVQSDDELLVTVKAVAIKHFDKNRSSGKHYSSDKPAASGRVIGGDGVCLLPDGTRVYGFGVSGMLAEKATIDKSRLVKVPDELDDITAAALPNAVIGAAMGLKFKANIQPGDVVLINGATGFTGRVAVQIAKHYGAQMVIVTGRNQQSSNDLLLLGADQIISLQQADDELKAQLKEAHAQTPFNVVIDYLWGRSAEIILSCLKGDGSFTTRTRYVSVGSITGDLIQLSAANLRSVDLQLTGSGLGAWSNAQIKQLFSEILPEMFQLAASGKLKVDTIAVKLENIAELWKLEVTNGQRLVVTI
ncbi:zinc-binding alcohol dehydrogenase family protein [Mucilaginibacter robiniae]|uniref:Zinc-binding alcohol dehydrogenase family protein n=1 Tax=Mucilaginibacter robiniae TaxID=2728022 RepID=A0A7L5DW44_9SPHI|nr:zinc-binding alcohol dehydrogenase family protein [Mucilaginibacter robiniae]QJD95312.1 zinc-binding alcohol dehydrogenase family protein [Mucilaginibacter robiniae]